MRFVAYSSEIADRPEISVDGLVDNTLNITHWPGNNTPAELKADITTEIAFKLVKSPRFEELTSGIDIITNNHFDADGVIPARVIQHPEEALAEVKEDAGVHFASIESARRFPSLEQANLTRMDRVLFRPDRLEGSHGRSSRWRVLASWTDNLGSYYGGPGSRS
jgi:hypothetical protein